MVRKHTLSQHFLRSPKIALTLVGHTNIKKSDITVDIGAGSGVFTYALSKKSRQVIAIEIDKATFDKLQNNFNSSQNVKLINDDIFNFDFSKISKDYKVCSNIPFNLSSKIILTLTNSGNPPKSIYLILQKQLAKKLVADDKSFTSAQGIKLYPFYKTKIRKPLRKTDFTPPPAVDTVFFEMARRPEPLLSTLEREKFNHIIDQSFSMPSFYQKIVSDELKNLKPSELTGEQWLAIFKNI